MPASILSTHCCDVVSALGAACGKQLFETRQGMSSAVEPCEGGAMEEEAIYSARVLPTIYSL